MGACSRKSENGWSHVVNLCQYPTKPEDLHVKMENDSSTLSVSGKSEVSKERNGMSVYSTHVWSKQIKIPDDVDASTLDCKMTENRLTFKAHFKKSPEHEITIENLD